jgi:hypothetical protein
VPHASIRTEFGKIDASSKRLHRSERRLQPEFGKIDAANKNRIDPSAGFGRSSDRRTNKERSITREK